jgi:quercetin dioxygenase-like cupin family protein
MRNPYVQNHFGAIWINLQKSLSPIPHLHKQVEMIYVKKGSALAYTDSKSVKITDGDLFIAFPNQIHYFLNSDIGEYYVLIFNTDILFGVNDIFYNKIPKSNVIRSSKKMK